MPGCRAEHSIARRKPLGDDRILGTRRRYGRWPCSIQLVGWVGVAVDTGDRLDAGGRRRNDRCDHLRVSRLDVSGSRVRESRLDRAEFVRVFAIIAVGASRFTGRTSTRLARRRGEPSTRCGRRVACTFRRDVSRTGVAEGVRCRDRKPARERHVAHRHAGRRSGGSTRRKRRVGWDAASASRSPLTRKVSIRRAPGSAFARATGPADFMEGARGETFDARVRCRLRGGHAVAERCVHAAPHDLADDGEATRVHVQAVRPGSRCARGEAGNCVLGPAGCPRGEPDEPAERGAPGRSGGNEVLALANLRKS